MTKIADALRERGIYVKAGFPDPMDHYLLVTCGGKDLMETFFHNFRQVFGKN